MFADDSVIQNAPFGGDPLYISVSDMLSARITDNVKDEHAQNDSS